MKREGRRGGITYAFIRAGSEEALPFGLHRQPDYSDEADQAQNDEDYEDDEGEQGDCDECHERTTELSFERFCLKNFGELDGISRMGDILSKECMDGVLTIVFHIVTSV